MPFDPATAADRLRAWAAHPPDPPAGGWPAGAPEGELTRTPAAARVGALSARDGLFLFHFERRAHLFLPEEWVPADRPHLAMPPSWQDGVLEERKYQSFRHDLPIGSFHPIHRAKWTVHELCHGLVGFTWRPGASRFFHATAGRLAELLPVTLWYFLDEVFLARCPDHQGGGALFRDVCPACERVARASADDPEALRRLEDGRRFLDRELAAIARSRRLGRPVSHKWATLDLCSDGVAYADAHADRLDSEAFLTFAARFLVEGGGWSPTLDDLEARVVATARAIVGEADLPPLVPTPTHGRWRWTLQDVAWRLLVVRTQSAGPVADGLDLAIERLAVACDETRRSEPGPDRGVMVVERAVADALIGAIALYRELFEDYELPDPEQVFAVGYTPIEGWGTDTGQVLDGIRSGCPLATTALGAEMDALLLRFLQDDLPAREPLAVRWSEFLARRRPGALADLARYEAALRTAPAGDGGTARALGWSGAGEAVRLAPTAALHRFATDVVGLSGALVAEGAAGAPPPGAWSADTALVVLRESDGEVGVVALPSETADRLAALGEGGALALPQEQVDELAALGVIAPARWSESSGGA